MMLKTKPTVGHRAARFAALAQAALLLFWGAVASAQDGNRLQDIQVQSLPGDRVELKLIMSETAPEPLDFTIENPARIALDLPDTALGMSQRRRDVNLGPLDTVLTAEANGRTRVVLNLGTMVEYDTRVSGNTVIVTLGDGVDGQVLLLVALRSGLGGEQRPRHCEQQEPDGGSQAASTTISGSPGMTRKTLIRSDNTSSTRPPK